MFTISARNVEEAWAIFHVMARDFTKVALTSPRGIKTLEFKEPVATTYRCPQENVLMDAGRDCNPFFHLYEGFHLLAGLQDVARLRYYNPQIQVYSDDQVRFHGAYGYRARIAGGNDQIEAVIRTLEQDPDSRRGVIALWIPSLDINATGAAGADIPCNTTVYFKIRDGALRMTVCNRSNDAVWGAYGANAVQFSVLQTYIAARLGVLVGPYTQMSDSLHVYLEGKAGDAWKRCANNPPALRQDYDPASLGLTYTPMVHDPLRFIEEVVRIVAPADGSPGRASSNFSRAVPDRGDFREPFLAEVAYPILLAHALYREHGPDTALEYLDALPYSTNAWMVSARVWLERRDIARRLKGQA